MTGLNRLEKLIVQRATAASATESAPNADAEARWIERFRRADDAIAKIQSALASR